MARLFLALKVLPVALGGILYVWIGGVRALPEVKRRKAARRGSKSAT